MVEQPLSTCCYCPEHKALSQIKTLHCHCWERLCCPKPHSLWFLVTSVTHSLLALPLTRALAQWQVEMLTLCWYHCSRPHLEVPHCGSELSLLEPYCHRSMSSSPGPGHMALTDYHPNCAKHYFSSGWSLGPELRLWLTTIPQLCFHRDPCILGPSHHCYFSSQGMWHSYILLTLASWSLIGNPLKPRYHLYGIPSHITP